MLKVNWGIDKVVIEALSEGDPTELRPELDGVGYAKSARKASQAEGRAIPKRLMKN